MKSRETKETMQAESQETSQLEAALEIDNGKGNVHAPQKSKKHKSRVKRLFSPSFIISHVLLVALFLIILLMPGELKTKSPGSFCVALGIAEIIFLGTQISMFRKDTITGHSGDVMCFVWLFFIAWELAISKFKLMNTVTFPAPENVFAVFPANWGEMMINAGYSLGILGIGFLSGTVLAIIFGLFVGWYPRLKSFFYPIARVMAPIPPMVYAPYVVLILPAFELTSVTLVALAIFLCVFLSTIISVSQINEDIINSARTLEIKGPKMIFQVLLPSALPVYIDALKVNMIIGFMMLVFAESIGSNYGMGHWISIYTHYGEYAKVFAGIIQMGVFVTIINIIVEAIQKHAIKWKAD